MFEEWLPYDKTCHKIGRFKFFTTAMKYTKCTDFIKKANF